MPEKYGATISAPHAPTFSPMSLNDAEDQNHPLVVLEIPCQWENYEGILTAGVQGLVFTGSFFLFETIVSMRWTSIQRLRYDNDHRGLLVVTIKNHEEQPQQQYVFVDVPKTHLTRLMHLQNEALSCVPMGCSSGSAASTSEETMCGSTMILDEGEYEDTDAACRSSTVTFLSLAERLADSVIEDHTGLPLSLQNISVSHNEMKGRFYAGPKGLVFTGRRYYFWDHAMLVLPWSSIWKIQKQGYNAVLVQSHDSRNYRLVVTDHNAVEEIWEMLVSCHNLHLTKTPTAVPPVSVGPETVCGPELRAETTTSETLPLQNLVVSNVEIPCSLAEFEDLFLRDHAKYSLANFLESRGDSDLQSSNWDDDSERVVRYLHPVNAPMAPPQARARKEQRLTRRQRQQREGPNDNNDDVAILVVETKTIVDDVPMTDCFFVLDRTTVKQVGGKTVQVMMEFEITFVKSTMFKGIIRSTTSREFTSMFQHLAEYYVTCITDPAKLPTVIVAVPPSSTTTSTSRSGEPAVKSSISSAVAILYILWSVTFVLQIMILRELRNIKAAMAKSELLPGS